MKNRSLSFAGYEERSNKTVERTVLCTGMLDLSKLYLRAMMLSKFDSSNMVILIIMDTQFVPLEQSSSSSVREEKRKKAVSRKMNPTSIRIIPGYRQSKRSPSSDKVHSLYGIL